MTLIYIDTNVWLDYFYDRKDRLRPLGSFAFELLRKAVMCQYTVIISDWVIAEVEGQGCGEEMKKASKWLNESKKLLFVHVDEDMRLRARKKSHWQDELHALLAEKANASFLVTRNIADFSSNRHSFEVVFPEKL